MNTNESKEKENIIEYSETDNTLAFIDYERERLYRKIFPNKNAKIVQQQIENLQRINNEKEEMVKIEKEIGKKDEIEVEKFDEKEANNTVMNKTKENNNININRVKENKTKNINTKMYITKKREMNYEQSKNINDINKLLNNLDNQNNNNGKKSNDSKKNNNNAKDISIIKEKKDPKKLNYLNLSLSKNDNNMFAYIKYTPELPNIDANYTYKIDDTLKEYITYVYNSEKMSNFISFDHSSIIKNLNSK